MGNRTPGNFRRNRTEVRADPGRLDRAADSCDQMIERPSRDWGRVAITKSEANSVPATTVVPCQSKSRSLSICETLIAIRHCALLCDTHIAPAGRVEFRSDLTRTSYDMHSAIART